MSNTKNYVKGLCGEYVEDWVSSQLAEELDAKDNKIERLQARVEKLEAALTKNIAQHLDEVLLEMDDG